MLGAAAVPAALVAGTAGVHLYLEEIVHFVGVGLTALAATCAAAALTVAGARLRDGRAVLFGVAFSTMAALLAVHGLATPGVLVGANGLVAFAGGATVPAGAVILTLSALGLLRGPKTVPRLLALQAALVAAIASLSVVGLLEPSLVPAEPRPGGLAALLTLTAGLALLTALSVRAARTFLLTRRRTDLTVLLGLGWLGPSMAAVLLLDYHSLGWWLGHCAELAGIGLVGGAVARDLRRSEPSLALAGDLRAAQLVSTEEVYLGSQVRALMLRLAEKDAYTEGHTRRVALRAVQVGEELGLPPGTLRILAIGGLLHDVGKLTIADDILKKPGPLDEAEFDEIRRHPSYGWELLAELGGFSEAVRRLVVCHHERLDGSGYPHGLTEGELDLPTRILAVCDVYDALRSARVYRGAWPHDEAMALLWEESAGGLDRRCVEALERILDGELAEEEPLDLTAAA